MVGRVAGEMDDFCLRISGLEDLVLVVEEAVESTLQFVGWHAVFVSEGLLDLGDPLADADGQCGALDTGHNSLDIRGCGQVVGMGVYFEDANDVVALCFDCCDQVKDPYIIIA